MSDSSTQYRLFPIGLAKFLNNKEAMTFLNLLFKSDFENGKSNVLLDTLAEISGYNTETTSGHLHKIEEISNFLKIERRCIGIVNGIPKTKNYYTTVIPTKDFIIVDKGFSDFKIDGLSKKAQHDIKGFIILIKCLCVNNTNTTFYSLRQIKQRVGLSYATIQNLMKKCRELGFIVQTDKGYEIKMPYFDLGNSRIYPNGTPDLYKSIYKDITNFCIFNKINVPPYKTEYISKIAVRFPYKEEELAEIDDCDIQMKYSIKHQLEKRLSTLPKEIKSLNYFVKVLTSEKLESSTKDKNTEYLI